MAEMELKRKLFGMNGNRIENFSFAKAETIEKWKNGELLFFPTEDCFSGFAITEDRDKKVPYLFDTEEKEDTEWHEKWAAMSPEEKASWWWEFIRANYVALTYDEFLADDKYIKQDLKMTFHLPSGDVDAVVFYTPKQNMMNVEV